MINTKEQYEAVLHLIELYSAEIRRKREEIEFFEKVISGYNEDITVYEAERYE